MSKKYFVLFGFVIGFILNIQSLAQPKLPYRDVGACPFECCTYRDWLATKPITVFKIMKAGSPIAFKLKKGEKVSGVTGVVITSVAGKVRVSKSQTLLNSEVKVKKGETLQILTYLGEGYYRFWYKGKVFDEDAFTDGLKILTRPKSVWWVKIKNRKGQIGWAISDGNFGNQDQCG